MFSGMLVSCVCSISWQCDGIFMAEFASTSSHSNGGACVSGNIDRMTEVYNNAVTWVCVAKICSFAYSSNAFGF